MYTKRTQTPHGRQLSRKATARSSGGSHYPDLSGAASGSAKSRVPGWVILPLRAFLGVTFAFAGLQKLADRSFFTAGAPGSIQTQMKAAANGSPIHGLVVIASHHAVLVGLVIAIGELAVGVGTLLGLWARVAAAGGALLSLNFFLTVSFHANPYYYGADIVFLFAWTPLIIAGAGDVLSLDTIISRVTRRQEGLPPVGTVPIEFATVRRLCGAFDKGTCRLRHGELCDPVGCPVLGEQAPRAERGADEVDRRTLLRKAAVAGGVGLGALVVGGVSAAVGRLVPSQKTAAGSAPLQGAGTPRATAPPASSSPTATAPASVPKGTRLGPASRVAVGGAASFVDPAQGIPAFVVQPSPGKFRAFSAICTHAGCTVQFSGSDETFQCPCHGAVYSAKTGEVLSGPAPQALPTISIAAGSDGELYVDG